MSKKILFLALACLLVLAPICIAAPADGARVTAGDLAKDNSTNQSRSTQVVNNDLYLFDQNVVVEGTINGNVFAFGSTVTVKGQITGDLFAFGNIVTVEDSASIYNNAFIGGNVVTFSGNAADVYVASSNCTLTESANIFRDLKASVETLNIKGLVRRYAYVSADNIVIPENAKGLIGGKLNYTSDKAIEFPEGAIVGGANYTDTSTVKPTASQMFSVYLVSFLTSMIYAIIVILIMSFYSPKFVEKATYCLSKRAFTSAGIGILAFILIPILAVLLLMLTVFMYVSVALLVIYALVLSITLPIFSVVVGKLIESKLKTPSRTKFIIFSILAAIVLWFAQLIPFVGGYISLFIYVVGLGVAIFAFFIRKDVSELGKKKEKN